METQASSATVEDVVIVGAAFIPYKIKLAALAFTVGVIDKFVRVNVFVEVASVPPNVNALVTPDTDTEGGENK
jgi:hypothetical protein